MITEAIFRHILFARQDSQISPFNSYAGRLSVEWNWGWSLPSFLYKPCCFSYVNNVACISTSASLPLKGQGTKSASVKLAILLSVMATCSL